MVWIGHFTRQALRRTGRAFEGSLLISYRQRVVEAIAPSAAPEARRFMRGLLVDSDAAWWEGPLLDYFDRTSDRMALPGLTQL